MDLMSKLLAHIAGALVYLRPFAISVTASFAIMDLVLYYLLEKEEDVLMSLVKKVLVYGVTLTILTKYDELVLKTFLNGAVQLGNMATGSSAITLVISPLAFFYKVMDLTAPAFTVSTLGAIAIDAIMDIESIPITLFFFILGLYFSTLLLSYELAMMFVEFYIVAITAIVLIPFGVFYKTRGIAMKAAGAIFGQGIKIMVMTFLLNFFNEAWDDYVKAKLETGFSILSWQNTCVCILVVLLLYGTLKRGPAIAHAMLMGSATSGAATNGFIAGAAGGSLNSGMGMVRSSAKEAYAAYRNRSSASSSSSYTSADKH